MVLGGASSGKSALAERLVKSQQGRHVYLASATASDPEMVSKIERHRTTRGPDWHTVEAPLNVANALENLSSGDVALFDCATLWLSNHMFENSDIDAETSRLLAVINSCPAPVVIVSNELGQGIVPDNRLARQFRDTQGKLNQQIATQADLVIMVAAGLPMVLKGQLPQETL